MEYKNSRTANRRRYKSRYHSPHSYKAKNPSSGKRAPILIGVATFLVLAALVLVFTFGDSIYTFLDNVFHPSAILPSGQETMGVMAVTEATEPSEPVTEAATEPPVAQTDEFTRLAAGAGLTVPELNTSQLIFVESAGTSARVYVYERDAQGVWLPKFDVMQGFVGKGGAADKVGPGEEKTPKGNFLVEYAMGTNPDPGTMIPYTQIYLGLRWVTDPNSVNYNRLVDTDTPIDYAECQELHEYTLSYPYALVLNYNRDPVDSTMGCAKFLHVSEGPTYGGVGISESDLYNILLWLDPGLRPFVCVF